MKTRSELRQEVMLEDEKELKIIENSILKGMVCGYDQVETYLSETQYDRLKNKIEESGFRSKFIKGSEGRFSSGSKVIIYI